MRKIFLVFLLLCAVAVVLLTVGGQHIPMRGVKLAASPDARKVADLTLKFLEDIQFKDFEKAASYHSSEDRKKVNIPYLIERIFQIKPEFLDILRYEILKVDIDSTGRRARVKTKTVIKILNTGKIKEPEVIFYWHKDPEEGWVMRLESSLR